MGLHEILPRKKSQGVDDLTKGVQKDHVQVDSKAILRARLRVK